METYNKEYQVEHAIRRWDPTDPIDICKLLLEDSEVNPTYKHNSAIIKASEAGNTDIVDLLLEYPNVNPSDQDNKALKLAINTHRPEIVKLLLEDDRIKTIFDGVPIIKYYLYNLRVKNTDLAYDAILEILIKSPKIDVSADDNRAIKKVSSILRYNTKQMEYYRQKTDTYTNIMRRFKILFLRKIWKNILI